MLQTYKKGATAAVCVTMSDRPTKEDKEAEIAFNARLIDAITAALIELPQIDLSKWAFRCGIFTALDKHIDAAMAWRGVRRSCADSAPDTALQALRPLNLTATAHRCAFVKVEGCSAF